MKEIPQGKTLILFDGVCNFCNLYINKIIQWDKKNQFVFASLQSEIGKKAKDHIGLNPNIDSIVYYKPGYAYYIKSQAILHIIKDTNVWLHPTAILRFIPQKISDWAYDFFAKNRYQWYGKKNECMIPTPEIKAKFLE